MVEVTFDLVQRLKDRFSLEELIEILDISSDKFIEKFREEIEEKIDELAKVDQAFEDLKEDWE